MKTLRSKLIHLAAELPRGTSRTAVLQLVASRLWEDASSDPNVLREAEHYKKRPSRDGWSRLLDAIWGLNPSAPAREIDAVARRLSGGL